MESGRHNMHSPRNQRSHWRTAQGGMPMARKVSSNQRGKDEPLFFLRRRTLGILFLVTLANTSMVLLLYSAVPRLGPDPELQPETHPRHLAIPSSQDPAQVVPTLSPARPVVPPIKQRSFKEGSRQVGLVHFSAYQVGEAEFWAVGLSQTSKQKLRQMGGCRWKSANGTVTGGNLTAQYPGEHHAKPYETIILHCNVDQPVLASQGGTLSMTVDGEEMAVFSQPPGSPEWSPPRPPFPRHLTYCGSPFYGDLDSQRVVEWLDFHRATHNIEYWHLYDAGGVDDELLRALQPYLDRNTVDVTDIRATARYETWLYSQVMVVNDCALRTRGSTQWALMMDIDEYLHVAEVPHSLKAFLQPMEIRPWISFGSLSYDTDTCRAAEDGSSQWAIERLVFHHADVHCRDVSKYRSRELCLKWDGHRKYVINPRNVSLLQIHRVMDPYDGGLDAHTSIIRLNHFRGLGVRNHATCKQLIAYPRPAPKGLVRDFTVARMALLARRKAR